MSTTSAQVPSASGVDNPHALVLSTARELGSLIGGGRDPQALASYLDGLGEQTRIAAVRRLSRRALGALYDQCANTPELTLEEFLPATFPAGKTLICSGLNSLPLFRKFEKRFSRTPSGAIIGFNFQTMAFITGPGYFTVVQAGREILIDYTKVPDQSEVPADWPKVKPNHRGLSRFVYKDMHDFCRRVSRDVLIGKATHLGTSIGQYFVLVRGAVS